MMRYMTGCETKMPVRTFVPGAAQVPLGRAFALFNSRVTQRDLLLHLLRGLPKEEVGRNGSSQNPH